MSSLLASAPATSTTRRIHHPSRPPTVLLPERMTHVNNSHLIEFLKASSSSSRHGRPTTSHPISVQPSAPLLLDPLPTTKLLDGEAQQLAIWEYEKQSDELRKQIELDHAMGGSIKSKPDEPDSRRTSSLFSSSSKDVAATGKAAGRKTLAEQRGKGQYLTESRLRVRLELEVSSS